VRLRQNENKQNIQINHQASQLTAQ